MPRWIDDIVAAMQNLGGYAPYADLYEEVKRIRTARLPRSWQAIIRNQVESFSSDSDNFRGEDLFYSVDGIGGGVWGLRNYAPRTPKGIDLDEDVSGGDDQVIHDPNEPYRVKQEVYRILRDTALARTIKRWHQYKCQICGERLQLKEGKYYAESHHIKPLGFPHHGPDIPGNILCVCPNHHALLDYGAISIERSRLRTHPKHEVDLRFIQYHNDHLCDQ